MSKGKKPSKKRAIRWIALILCVLLAGSAVVGVLLSLSMY
mgnify:CR=1 FL=1|jgi:flagellar basal body-associated protein FliL